MKIAVISDTHDQIWRLQEILPNLNEADVLLHCGDLCSPFMVHAMGNCLNIPAHIVLGNNDGDVLALKNAVDEYDNLHLYSRLIDLELDSLHVAVLHYPELAIPLAGTGTYDLVVHGHDHRARSEQIGGCLLLNPGELMGLFGTSSYAFVETETGDVSFVEEVVSWK